MSRIFRSFLFMSWHLIPNFQVLHFLLLHFQRLQCTYIEIYLTRCGQRKIFNNIKCGRDHGIRDLEIAILSRTIIYFILSSRWAVYLFIVVVYCAKIENTSGLLLPVQDGYLWMWNCWIKILIRRNRSFAIVEEILRRWVVASLIWGAR